DQQRQKIGRYISKYKMRQRPDQCRKCHDKDAGPHRHLYLITEDHIQDKEHHQPAPKSYETAVKADVSARQQRKEPSALLILHEASPVLPGGTEEKLYSHKQSHRHGK